MTTAYKISELPTSTALVSGDHLVMVVGGVTKQIGTTDFGSALYGYAGSLFSDVTANDASTARHGFVIKAVSPNSGLMNVLGIASAEGAWSNKAVFDAVTATTQAFSDTAAAGTVVIAARRDHLHGMMATPTSFVAKMILYWNDTVANIPAGWAEATAVRGRTIVGMPASGTLAGTVGSALTNLQDVTHTHTGPSHTHTGAVHTHSDSGTTSGPNVYYDNTIQSGSGRSAAREDHTHTYSSTTGNPSAASTGAEGTGATGANSAAAHLPYINLVCIEKSA